MPMQASIALSKAWRAVVVWHGRPNSYCTRPLYAAKNSAAVEFVQPSTHVLLSSAASEFSRSRVIRSPACIIAPYPMTGQNVLYFSADAMSKELW
jgi:hypothetical protein